MTTWVFQTEVDDNSGNMISKVRLEGTLATDGNIVETSTTANPPQSTTVTVTPPASTKVYQSAGVINVITNSITARNGVLGTGIPAFILGIVFLLLLGVSRRGKGYPWFKPLSIVICVLTAVMTFLGVFLYAKVLNIGYSFIIWAGFAIFALLGGIFTGIPHSGSKGRFIPLACMTVALALGVAALATTSWYSELDDNGTPNRVVTTSTAGVKAYSVVQQIYDTSGTNVVSTDTITSTFSSDTFHRVFSSATLSEDRTITKCPTTPAGGECYDATALENGIFKDFITGGQKALGCGIPALMFCVAAMVAMGTLLRGSPPQHAKLVAIVCACVASGLGFLGLFLYAAITSVGASFVVYAAAGFLWVLTACMAFSLLNSGGDSTTARPAAQTPTDTKATTGGTSNTDTTQV